MKKHYRKSFILIYIVIFFLFYCSYLAISYLYKPRHFSNSSITYILSPGTSTHKLAVDLKDKGIIKYPLLFKGTVRLEGRMRKLRSGEYNFPSGISLQAILNKMTTGDVVRYELTIVDGWTFKQLMQVLETNPYLQHSLSGLTSEEIAAKLKLTHQNPEGLFLPETYQFTWPDSDEKILRRAQKALEKVLNRAWQSRTTAKVYRTPYQALIAASLIQKESGMDAERNKISGVIYRRLQKRMRLQIDPTVIYALGEQYKGKLTRKSLRVVSPYNTYKVYGLPPTPIALPGKNAIEAAMQPDNGDELYFVAKGNGGHYFSRTLKEHQRAIKKYLLKSNK